MKADRFPWVGFLATVLFWANIAAAPGKDVLAYYERESSSAALHARYASFNQISADTYSVNNRGIISGETFTNDLRFAQDRKMKTFAAISNFEGDDFKPGIAHSIISSFAFTQTFITGMLEKLGEGHYTGLNIDFESVPDRDRKKFTSFIKTVADKLHAAGYLLVISVPAEQKDDPGNSWTGAFDLAALGGLADVLQVMTYDENGTWSEPGPVAGLDWVEATIKYTVSVVPPAKISLGLPAYGYDWDLTNSKGSRQIPWVEISTLLSKTRMTPEWDASSSSPHFTYTMNGHKHVVWYENAQSLGLKVRLVNTYQLAGVSIYALGMENDSFWQAVHAEGL